MVFTFNKYHSAVGLTMANAVTSKLHTANANINLFFTAKQNAKLLAQRNAEMQNTKATNYLVIDTTTHEIADYIVLDTLGNTKKILQYIHRPATVIYNTTNNDLKNYMVISRGTNNGIRKDMAVVGAESNAVIGKVMYADANTACIMTLLHNQSSVPAKLMRSGDNGTVYWQGKSNTELTLKKIPKTATLKIGDTVVTSLGSDIFPENLIIGTITSYTEDKTNGNFIITLKPKANFNNVNYVNVIENMQQANVRSVVQTAQKQLLNN